MSLPNLYFLALKSGREDGLKHYMKVHGSALRYFAYGFLRDKALAEEIVSDAFVKLWTGRDKLHTESSVQAFLYISTKNACLDERNRLRNRTIHDNSLLEELESPSEDTLTRMIQVELIKLIIAEVDHLPLQQSRVFKLTYFEQMKTEEISKELGISASSVYFARSKALSSLKKMLGFKGHKNLQELIFLFLLGLVMHW